MTPTQRQAAHEARLERRFAKPVRKWGSQEIAQYLSAERTALADRHEKERLARVAGEWSDVG